MPLLLSLDPGQHTGWALFEHTPNGRVLAVSIQTGKGSDWIERSMDLCRWLQEFLADRPSVKTLYCELPMVFDGASGHMAAVEQVPVKLAYLVGGYAGVALSLGRNFHPVSVHQWKGQASKEIVKNRIVAILGKQQCRGYKKDIWDAVGVGLWALGRLQ